ncbi:MAG TPA: hypothetical protein VGJ93_01025 [Desulfuromonadaceae bacterium]|jgi:hypothetical protein
MLDQLLRKLEESDRDGAADLTRDEITKDGQAWKIHLSLFPLAQRVLNPPFINPHLPKMHAIYRKFLPYVMEDDLPSLVHLEIKEFARRPKFEALPKPSRESIPVPFSKIETAIEMGNKERVAYLLYAYLEQNGKAELARNLLLLGSGYMEQSLGHSVSCTAFILLEMIERSDQDPWPALATLADYFCNGGFHAATDLDETTDLPSEDMLIQYLSKATSGSGFLNLHHTITRYSIEQVRHLLTESEYAHLIACWIKFIGNKEIKAPSLDSTSEPLGDYQGFYQVFSKREERQVLSFMEGAISSQEGRLKSGRYLIKGVCDMYQGNYDPHFLTGLGSVLWVMNDYWDQPVIVMNALSQYMDYFFGQV